MMAFVIDSKTEEHKLIDVEPSLAEYYRIIGCRCIDIINRKVSGRDLCIIVDDEGLLKPNRCTAESDDVDMFRSHEHLVGTLIILGEGEDGELRGLTTEESFAIEGCIEDALFSDGSRHPILRYTW